LFPPGKTQIPTEKKNGAGGIERSRDQGSSSGETSKRVDGSGSPNAEKQKNQKGIGKKLALAPESLSGQEAQDRKPLGLPRKVEGKLSIIQRKSKKEAVKGKTQGGECYYSKKSPSKKLMEEGIGRKRKAAG